jgi:hypothetical protein
VHVTGVSDRYAFACHRHIPTMITTPISTGNPLIAQTDDPALAYK